MGKSLISTNSAPLPSTLSPHFLNVLPVKGATHRIIELHLLSQASYRQKALVNSVCLTLDFVFPTVIVPHNCKVVAEIKMLSTVSLLSSGHM